jgi:hypothetical protein
MAAVTHPAPVSSPLRGTAAAAGTPGIADDNGGVRRAGWSKGILGRHGGGRRFEGRVPLAIGHDSPVQRAVRGSSGVAHPPEARVSPLVVGWLGALALLMLGPALGPGFALSYDMVFVPDQTLSAASLGASDSPPRAVPVDGVIAVLDNVVPGVVLHKLALVAILLMAGWGAARLVAPAGRAAQAMAGTVYLWNPYVGERLAIGHWSLLAAYAALPWLACFAGRLRRRPDLRTGAVLVLLGLVAGLTPTGAVLGGVVVGAVLAWPGAVGRARRLAAAAAVWTGLALPWLVAGALSGPWLARPGAAALSVDLFASRSEGPLGLPGTLAGFGGIWNADVVPGSRELGGGWMGLMWTGLVLVVAVLGAGAVRRVLGRGLSGGLCAAAVIGIVVAFAGATPGLRTGLVALVEHVPPAGLLRDGQRWVAPWALLVALAAGLGAARISARIRERDLARFSVGALVVLTIALVPDLAYGVGGQVRAASYPKDWQAVRRVLDHDGHPGSVAVVPYETFRAFRFTGRRTVLDPAPRYLPRDTVTSDDLHVGRRTVPGESRISAEVGAVLGQADATGRAGALRALGVGWLLVERDQPGPVPDVPGAQLAYSGPDLRLLRIPGVVAARPPRHLVAVAAANAVPAAIVAGSAGWLVLAWGRRRRRSVPVTLESPVPEGHDPA